MWKIIGGGEKMATLSGAWKIKTSVVKREVLMENNKTISIVTYTDGTIIKTELDCDGSMNVECRQRLFRVK
jgi:hypothetical protein